MRSKVLLLAKLAHWSLRDLRELTEPELDAWLDEAIRLEKLLQREGNG